MNSKALTESDVRDIADWLIQGGQARVLAVLLLLIDEAGPQGVEMLRQFVEKERALNTKQIRKAQATEVADGV